MNFISMIAKQTWKQIKTMVKRNQVQFI